MGRAYSYSQPSQSAEFGCDYSDSASNEIEALIQQDQAEIEAAHQHQAQLEMNASTMAFVYPPQPEVEFGFPQRCYCGSEPRIATSYSRTDPGRRYYTCRGNVQDGECHVWKWWDEAVMEEMGAASRHISQLAEKVDSLNFSTDYVTEQKIVRLENLVSELAKTRLSSSRFDLIVAVMVFILIVIGIVLYIVHRLSHEVQYFRPSEDATGRSSLSPLQKCTAAVRQLAYGAGADIIDEYVRLGETTARKCLHQFTAGIISLFGDEYLRHHTPEDLERLLHVGEQRGFPGMIGSIDCMHWEWKNCPAAWKGMYSRGTEKLTIVLEAVASYDLWIWHAFFGAPGTMNDLNILDRSPVFDEIINGNAPEVNFFVNGREYHLAYYLADGIYPKWATFIQSIRLPQTPKHCLFANRQEAVRKYVERAFGVLQSRFAVVRNPSALWSKHKIGNIMKACIILHNMIVQDERDSYAGASEFEQGEDVDPTFVVKRPTNLGNTMGRRADVRDTPSHHQLKEDLIENIWVKFGHLPNDYDV